MSNLHAPYEKREKELVAATVYIRAQLALDDAFWSYIDKLNHVLEPYGYAPIKQP